jgi:hypothetical protein
MYRQPMAKAKPSPTVSVTAVPFSAMVQQRLLEWPTPMRDLLTTPDAGDFVWRRLQYVFQLPDPRTFPAKATALTADEVVMLGRFVAQARRLAGTSFMGASDRVQINIPDDNDGPEHIEQELSAPDITTGHMVFLRQCYADDEEASFSKVRKVLEARLHQAGESAALDILKAWRKAHARLLNQSLEEHVQERMVVEGLMPGQSTGPDGQARSMIVRDPASPMEMLRLFWYGDQIHWGKHREALAAITADPYDEAMWQISARQAASDLAHFYLGFALVVVTALP